MKKNLKVFVFVCPEFDDFSTIGIFNIILEVDSDAPYDRNEALALARRRLVTDYAWDPHATEREYVLIGEQYVPQDKFFIEGESLSLEEQAKIREEWKKENDEGAYEDRKAFPSPITKE